MIVQEILWNLTLRLVPHEVLDEESDSTITLLPSKFSVVKIRSYQREFRYEHCASLYGLYLCYH